MHRQAWTFWNITTSDFSAFLSVSLLLSLLSALWHSLSVTFLSGRDTDEPSQKLLSLPATLQREGRHGEGSMASRYVSFPSVCVLLLSSQMVLYFIPDAVIWSKELGMKVLRSSTAHDNGSDLKLFEH